MLHNLFPPPHVPLSLCVQDFHVAVGEDQQGLQLVFEMLHLFLEQPRWDDSAMERAKQAFLSGGR